MVDGAAGVGEGATVDVVVGVAGVSVGAAVAVALAAGDVGDGVLVSESELEQAAKTATVKGKRAAAANFASQLGRIRDSCMFGDLRLRHRTAMGTGESEESFPRAPGCGERYPCRVEMPSLAGESTDWRQSLTRRQPAGNTVVLVPPSSQCGGHYRRRL